MFKLSEKYEINRKILKCDYIRYSPSEISTINTPNSQIYINIPREDSVISLLHSYIEINFDVLKLHYLLLKLLLLVTDMQMLMTYG